MDLDDAASAFREFVSVVKALRTPGTGCRWDLEQTHRTLRPYLLEETYELLEAIEAGDDRALREELGDVLLQVVLHAQLAWDRAAFDVKEVLERIIEKMVRRHPHVFGGVSVSGTADVLRNWERIKEGEAGGKRGEGAGPLAGVPRTLPALARAQRLGAKAARASLDEGAEGYTLSLVRARLVALEKNSAALPRGEATAQDERRARVENDLGEVLFALCQVARHLGINAEDSLRATCARFEERIDAKHLPASPPVSGGADA
jgi:MazG family protein